MVAVQTPGNTAYEDGTFVVRGAGTDLSVNNQDITAQFVRQPVTGDCEITARLVSRSGASGDRVGPLMAKSPSPFDQAAGAIVTGGTGAQLMLRTTVAGKSAFTGNTTVGAPCLLRLKRTGTTFTACASTDDGATCALRRQVGGTEANAECAAKILNAWSSTLTTVTGNADRFLAAGIYGWEFAPTRPNSCAATTRSTSPRSRT